MNKFVNVLRETESNCAKQEVSSFEKHFLCAPGVTYFPIHSSRYSLTVTNGTNHSLGAYSTPHEVSQLFESPVSYIGHWSTSIGMSIIGLNNSLESWGTKNYSGPFLNSHVGVTGFGYFSQQPAQ